MTPDSDPRKYYLKQLQLSQPLQPFWLKKDRISPCEAILIYYEIGPTNSPPNSAYMNEQLIQVIDIYGIYQVLLTSEFYNKLHRPSHISLSEFIDWLQVKEFEIPKHLKFLLPAEKSITKDEMDLTPTQLRRQILRYYAALHYKTAKGEAAKISAKKLAESKEFEGFASYIEMPEKEPKKIAEIFSDLGPRSHKRKKLQNNSLNFSFFP